ATAPTQIRIDSTIKEQANSLFSSLGLDMSSAVNIFLRQCILRGGLPFAVV
ncbi:type II toxin-antitoxin system RelB/DinJ family antitoxin, partial [Pseudomonas aeruginosa]